MKKLTVGFIIIYVILLALPAVTMPLFKGEVSTENRELSEFPELRGEDGAWNREYTSELDTWIQEHIGFRRWLVDANGAWQTILFGHSPEESIIFGKDGWLYYADTKYDYMNVPTLTERNANNAAKAMLMLQKYAKEQGAAFSVALVPNKNTLYGEHMPYYYRPTEGAGNLELVTEAMKRYGVNYADIKAAFDADARVLYQPLDSHWTYEGALLGYETIMKSLGGEYEPFDGITFEARKDWDGDLAGMLYAGETAKVEQLYPNYSFGYEIVSKEKNPDAITLRTEHEGGRGSVVMYRDSFCNTMQVYVAENYEKAVFSRAYPFRAEYITRYDADACVLEIVERNIANLAAKAPLMPAAQAILDVSASSMGDAYTLLHEKNGSYTHLFGEVDETYLGTEYEVYVLHHGADGVTAYEAFPIYEQELMGKEMLGDNGYSVYLPGDICAPDGSYSVVIHSEGKYYATTTKMPTSVEK